jgi:hypothetical protein
MSKQHVKLRCNKCGSEMDVDELLIHQFEDSIREDLKQELASRESELKSRREEYNLLLNQLEMDKEQMNDLVNSKVKSQLLLREETLKESIRKEINEERSLQLQSLEDELVKKSAQLRALNGTKADLIRLQREMEEKETEITLRKEKELTERLEQAKINIKEQIHQEQFLKLKEKETIIQSLREKLSEAITKSQQGSMKTQGDVMEIELCDALSELHPHDEFSRAKVGVAGGDILQIVKTQQGVICGSIYYESKNTSAFSQSYISKLKQDNLEMKADLLILVTKSLPQEMIKKNQRYAIIENVWVCDSVNSAKELSLILRFGLLKLQSVKNIHEGKESKMGILYNYLTSEEFKNIFTAIMEDFKLLQDANQSEKLKFLRNFQEKQKVLDRILANCVDFYASMKGIAGSSIPEIKLLDSSNDSIAS